MGSEGFVLSFKFDQNKFKTMKKTLLILTTLLSSIIGYSQTFISNGISYEVITGTNKVNVTGYDATFGNQVTIPKSVLHENKGVTLKYSVTEIGLEAFKAKGLISISLPEGLEKIKNRAFYNNQIAGTLIIPNSVTSIEAHAFNSNAITNLNLGNGIEVILTGVFSNNNLTSLTLPSQISVVDWGAFGNNQIATLVIENGVGQLNARFLWDNPLTTIISNSVVPPTITTGGNDDSFNMNHNVDDRANIDLKIPSGTMGAYVTDLGAKWTGFKSVTEDPVLSTSAFNLEDEITVFNTEEYLKVISSSSTRLKSYTIYSMSGSVKNGTESNIDITYLPKGIYIVELSFDKGKMVKKFMK